jgi:CHAT domain-containing protein
LLEADDRHLTEAELESLAVEGAAGQSAARPSDVKPERSTGHLAGCSDCSARLAQYIAARIRLAMLKSTSHESRASRCPAEERWFDFAAGFTSKEQSEELLEHVAACDHCSTRLREIESVFSDRVSPDEEAILQKLKSSEVAWQRQMASRLRSGHAPKIQKRASSAEARRSDRGRYRWAYALAAFLLLAVSGWWLMRQKPEARALRLIAEAYTEQRTVAMRFVGADYGPIRQTRSGPGSALSRPAPLLEAEVLVSKHLRSESNRPEWLLAKGRVELLEWNYTEAIESLEMARKLGAASSSLVLCDLATAYFERGQSEDQPQDFTKALDLLGEALQQNPNSPILIFNHAIVEESLQLYDQARADWDRFLELEPTGSWANEARSRRDQVLQKLNLRSEWNWLLDTDPKSASRSLRHRIASKAEDAGWPDSLDEAYLDIAVTRWLPNSVRDRGEAGGPSNERNASEALATVFENDHNDRWLNDLLRSDATANWLEGVQSLADAVESNRTGDSDRARRSARMAENLFRSGGNQPGRLGAELESVVALKRAQMGPACLSRGVLLDREVEGRGYPWLEISNLLETSSCYGLVGNPGKAKELADRAAQLSAENRFGYLHLRSLCWEDGVGIDAPDASTPEAWSKVNRGLAEFWAGPHTPTAAVEFYEDLGFLAEGAEYWHAAEAIGRETILLAQLSGDRSYEAAGHHWLAQMARMANDTQLAEAEFDAASDSFRSFTSSEASKMNWVTLELERVSLETRSGDFRKASARLEQLRLEIPRFSDFFAALLYYQTEGELYLAEGNRAGAEKALEAAIQVREAGFSPSSEGNDANLLAWDRHADRVYRDLVRLFLETDAEKALDLWEWYRGDSIHPRPRGAAPRRLDFAALDDGPPLPAIPRARKARRPGETAVSFAVFPAGLAIWVLDDQGVKSNWVSLSEENLRATARQLEQLSKDPSSDLLLLNQSARQLYHWLIAPIRDEIRGTHALRVELDDALDGIPVQALLSPENEYLGQEFAITIGMGLSPEANNAGDVPFSGREPTLIVSNAVAGAEFPPLSQADREAEGVAARFEAARIVTGREATTAFLQRELPRAEVVHFAGHAVFERRGTGLVLSRPIESPDQDPSFELFDAAKLKPLALRNTRLVVLSACETANSDLGLVGSKNLVRGFLERGVPHVLASRWQVDDHAAAELMDVFYSNLLVGRSVTNSLQLAEETLRHNPSMAHPYYWAAFSAFAR